MFEIYTLDLATLCAEVAPQLLNKAKGLHKRIGFLAEMSLG